MAKISFKTRKGNKVTYDGRKTVKTRRKELLAENVPMFISDPSIFNSYARRDIPELFYDAMKIWFIAFLMMGWAGLVIRFIGWLFGG